MQMKKFKDDLDRIITRHLFVLYILRVLRSNLFRQTHPKDKLFK